MLLGALYCPRGSVGNLVSRFIDSKLSLDTVHGIQTERPHRATNLLLADTPSTCMLPSTTCCMTRETKPPSMVYDSDSAISFASFTTLTSSSWQQCWSVRQTSTTSRHERFFHESRKSAGSGESRERVRRHALPAEGGQSTLQV